MSPLLVYRNNAQFDDLNRDNRCKMASVLPPCQAKRRNESAVTIQGWPIHNRVRPPRTRVPAVSPHRTCPKGMEPVSLAKISLPLLSQLREQNPSNCAIRSLNGLAIACHYHARPGTPREPTAKKQALAGLELMSFLIEHREWSHWRMIRDDR